MGSVIGELLPLAIGVAISPIPIVATILMLLSKNAGSSSVGFGAGWVTGILLVTIVAVLLAGSVGTSTDAEPSTTVSWIKVILGLLLLLVAGKQWHDRDDSTPPAWMRAIDRMTFWKATGLGILLSAANPKNLLLCVSAGVAIGTGGLAAADKVVAIVVFTVLAAATVLGPVVGYTVARDRMSGALDSMKNWLQSNNHQVMAIVLLIMGATVVGKGLGGLF